MMEIKSAELWDRLELILGDKASLLPPRPEGSSYPHSTRLDVDKMLKLDARDIDPAAKAEMQRLVEGLKTFAESFISKESVQEKRPDPSTIVSVFTASFEHLDGEGHVSGTSMTFTAANTADSIASVVRFWIGRQSYPEFFGRLFCVKIFSERIGPVSETGQLFNGSSFPFFEWKVDGAGMPLEMYAVGQMLDHIIRRCRASRGSA